MLAWNDFSLFGVRATRASKGVALMPQWAKLPIWLDLGYLHFCAAQWAGGASFRPGCGDRLFQALQSRLQFLNPSRQCGQLFPHGYAVEDLQYV